MDILTQSVDGLKLHSLHDDNRIPHSVGIIKTDRTIFFSFENNIINID